MIIYQRRHLWWSALLALLFASAAAIGQSSSLRTATQPVKSGSITGTVVNENGQPLPNALVSVRPYGALRPVPGVITDSEGKFEVNGLEHVTYQITVFLGAYIPAPRDENNPNNYRVGDSARLVMMKGGVITGTVTTQAGDPVVGVRVRAGMIADVDRQPIPYQQVVRERMTDDRGVYRIYGLPPGTYVVSAGGGGGSYSGLDPYDADVPTYSPASTRDTAGEVVVRAGDETSNVDITYRGDAGRIVSGTVATPPSQTDSLGVTVNLTSAADSGAQWNITSFQSPDGRGFAFYGVDDGDYHVTARTFDGARDWGLSAPKRIRVRGADVTGVELHVKPLGSVSGQIVLEELKTKECADKQRPFFTETLVSAWHKDDEAAKRQPGFIWGLGTPVNADAQGNILLRNLATGDYYFVARVSAKSWYLQSISLAPAATQPSRKPVDATRVWTNIKNGDRITGIKIVLAEGAASLTGQLALAEGETLPEKLFVYLVPAEKEKADEVLRFYAAPVLADGKISMKNLAPGRYWILAKPASDGAQRKMRLPDETATRARLRREGEEGKREIELKPCQDVVDHAFKIGSH